MSNPHGCTSQEHIASKEHLRRGGLRGPLCYYRVRVGDYNVADSKGTSLFKSKLAFSDPVLAWISEIC